MKYSVFMCIFETQNSAVAGSNGAVFFYHEHCDGRTLFHDKTRARNVAELTETKRSCATSETYYSSASNQFAPNHTFD